MFYIPSFVFFVLLFFSCWFPCGTGRVKQVSKINHIRHYADRPRSNFGATHHVETIGDQSLKLMMEEKWSDAVRTIESALDLDPSYDYGWWTLARCYKALGLRKRSMSYFKHFKTLLPTSALGYHELELDASVALDSDLRTILSDKDKKLQSHPTSRRAEHSSHYSRLGAIFQARGKTDLALQFYWAAHRWQRNDPSTLYFVGLSFMSYPPGDMVQAEQFQRAALLLAGGTYSLPYFELGRIARQQNKLDEAITYFIKAIDNDPDIADFYAHLAESYAQSKQMALAIEHYKYAVKIHPRDSFAVLELAHTYRLVGKFDFARKLLNDVLDMNPNCAEAYVELGRIAEKAWDYDEAVEMYEKAVEMDALNRQGLSWLDHRRDHLGARQFSPYQCLSRMYAKLERYGDALQIAREGISINPTQDQYKSLWRMLLIFVDFDGVAELQDIAYPESVDEEPAAPPGIHWPWKDEQLWDARRDGDQEFRLGSASINYAPSKLPVISKIRVAVFAAEGAHMQSVLALYGQLDPMRFEVSIFVPDLEDLPTLQEHLVLSSARAVDLTTLGPEGAARRIHLAAPDVLLLVDFASSSFTKIVGELRPCRIQIALNSRWIMATSYLDYYVTDRVAATPACRKLIGRQQPSHFFRSAEDRERLIIMPDHAFLHAHRLWAYTAERDIEYCKICGECNEFSNFERTVDDIDVFVIDQNSANYSISGEMKLVLEETDQLLFANADNDTLTAFEKSPVTNRSGVLTPWVWNNRVRFGFFGEPEALDRRTLQVWGALARATNGSFVFRHDLFCEIARKNLRREMPGADVKFLYYDPLSPTGRAAAMSRIDFYLESFRGGPPQFTADALWFGKPVFAVTGSLHSSRVVSSAVLAHLKGFGLAQDLVFDDIARAARAAYRLVLRPNFYKQISKRLKALRYTSPLFDSDKWLAMFGNSLQKVVNVKKTRLFPTHVDPLKEVGKEELTFFTVSSDQVQSVADLYSGADFSQTEMIERIAEAKRPH